MNDITGKYITISGLQGFYTGLKNTYQPTLTATAASAKQAPPHTSAVSAAIHTVTTAAAAAAAIGVAAQEYAEGVSSYITNHEATWSQDTKSIAEMTDYANYFNTNKEALKSVSASKAVSAGTADKAKALTGNVTIAATGDATLNNVAFSGPTSVTGNIQINSVPWSAVTGLTATGAQTAALITPKAVDDKIAAAMVEKASWLGPETALSRFSTPYDKTAIYLVGPIGGVTGDDKYNEYIVTGTAGTTADFLLIGDTTTDLAAYMKTSAFEAWTTATTSTFSGTASNAVNAAKLGGVAATNIINSAASGAAASAWVTAHSGDYALAGHNHAYQLKANTTALNLSGTAVTLSAGNNVSLAANASNKTITISAKDTIPSNAKITITTATAGASTGSFTLDQSSSATITLGTMALANSADFLTTADKLVPFTSAEVINGIDW